MSEPADPRMRRTVAHYQASAGDFWAGTRTHDVSQNISALLTALGDDAPSNREARAYDVLDFGCGPGRDLMAFRAAGHRAKGLDACPSFVRMAREHSGCEVFEQDFLALDLPAEAFDGVYANASLFHVPTAELPRVLGELWATLRPGGVLFSSNPRGDNREGFNGDRWAAYHDHDAWSAFLRDAGFEEVTHYYRPDGLPRAEQPWLAVVARKRPRV